MCSLAVNDILQMKNDFLKPETRCGTFISAEKKAALKVMLDILEVIIRICERHKLMYVASGGTLLGAVRHKGFIPWDDDIDIEMPRKDYELFQRVAPKELPVGLFMQNWVTDPQFKASLVKIVDVRTAAIDPYDAEQKRTFKMGIHVDVNPVDGRPDSRFALWLNSHLIRLVNGIRMAGIRRNREGCGIPSKIRHAVAFCIYKALGIKRLYQLQEWLCGRYTLRDCKYCSEAPAQFGYFNPWCWESSMFDETVELPFEYLMVRCPKRYEESLTKSYGDWRKFEKGTAAHGNLIMDAKKDYLTILKEDFGYTDRELKGFK